MTKDSFITGFRRTLLNKGTMFFCWCMLKLLRMTVKFTVLSQDDVDYSHYLGPDYRREKFNGHIPKVISPHVSTFDT